MLTEDYNGICPKCQFDRVLVRYGSSGWFQYVACPSCEFAIGDNGVEIYDQKEIWKTILEAEGEHIEKAGFERSVKGVKDWVNSMEEPTDKFIINLEDKHCYSYKIEERVKKCPDCVKSANNICDKHADEWFRKEAMKNG